MFLPFFVERLNMFPTCAHVDSRNPEASTPPLPCYSLTLSPFPYTYLVGDTGSNGGGAGRACQQETLGSLLPTISGKLRYCG